MFMEASPEKVRRILSCNSVKPEKLSLVPDCGFSQTARHLATAKLEALVAGRDLVRGRGAATPTAQEEATR